MKRFFLRRNSHTLQPDASFPSQSRWMRSQWVGKLRASYQQASDWFTVWITDCIRNWENRNSVQRRRQQVLLLFGGIGLGWIIRLIYLLQQPPALSSLQPHITPLGKEARSGLARLQEPATDSTLKADYLQARSGATRSGKTPPLRPAHPSNAN